MNISAAYSPVDVSKYLLPPAVSVALADGDIPLATRLLRNARDMTSDQAAALIQAHVGVDSIYLRREDGSNWKVPGAVQLALDYRDTAAATALLQGLGGLDRREAEEAVAWLRLHRVAAGAGAATAGSEQTSAMEAAESEAGRRWVWALVLSGAAIGLAAGVVWAASRRTRGQRG